MDLIPHERNRLLGFDRRWPLPNVWLGVSAEKQYAAEARIPYLLKTPAAIRFVSIEPLLEHVDLDEWVYNRRDEINHLVGGPLASNRDQAESLLSVLPMPIDWVIVGGESGPRRRDCEVRWVTDIVNQCRDAEVPVFVKQDSGPGAGQQGRIPDEYWVQEFPKQPWREKNGKAK
jgi:protein gp37